MTALWKNNRALLIIVAVVVVLLAGLIQSLEPKVWVSIMLSGATLAALYFLVASGLSLIFGLMDVLNFAHGVLFVLGAYVGLSTFMNPRLLFNTLPFFFVVVAAVALAQHFGRFFWRRIGTLRGRQVATAVLLLVGVGLVLLALRGFPDDQPVTIGDLADRLLLHHHSTVELIDRSARQGFVERQRDDADRRRVIIRLTPAGAAILRDLSVHHRSELRTTGPALAAALTALLAGDAAQAGQPPG